MVPACVDAPRMFMPGGVPAVRADMTAPAVASMADDHCARSTTPARRRNNYRQMRLPSGDLSIRARGNALAVRANSRARRVPEIGAKPAYGPRSAQRTMAMNTLLGKLA